MTLSILTTFGGEIVARLLATKAATSMKRIHLGISPQLVINYLKFGSELTGRENNVLSGFPELFAKEINWTSTRRNIAGINSRFALENSSSDVMLDLSKRMESNSGFNFPHSVAFYVSLWNSANSSASYSIDTLTALPLNAKLVASMTRHSVKDALDY